jgi:putative flippase GtrA
VASTGLYIPPVDLTDHVLALVPGPIRSILLKRREEVKFLIVGGVCFLIAAVINYALKFTILDHRPVTALTVANIITMAISYLLNREWSFRTRGGRRRHHEASLFFILSGIGVGVASAPLWVSRYVFQLQVPTVSRPVQELADFVIGLIIGTLLGMLFRLWSFRRWVFPEENARPGRTSSPYSGPTSPDADARTNGHPINGRPVATEPTVPTPVNPAVRSAKRPS